MMTAHLEVHSSSFSRMTATVEGPFLAGLDCLRAVGAVGGEVRRAARLDFFFFTWKSQTQLLEY
jgi:hypothetical protein